MKPHLIVRLGLVCLLTILAVSAAAADQSTAGPDQIGSKATASWTETTEKAATTPEQKKILERCHGLFYSCAGGAEARRFNRLLIDAGLIKGLSSAIAPLWSRPAAPR